MCHKGEWQVVIVDDLFPCYLDGNLIYSQASRRQLWVPLIEKAMAKLNGSYEALIAGQTIEGLYALTGLPCDSIRLEKSSYEEEIDYAMIWARLISMKEAGYAMGASCGRKNILDNNVFTSRGLLPSHAYSVLNVRDINGNKLLQLRNPWGRFTWQGDWSENSPKWTHELREALGLNSNHNNQNVHNDRGVFWISFNDLINYFSKIDICKSRLDWYESRMSGSFKPEGDGNLHAFQLEVLETTEINITLFHKSPKNRAQNEELDMCFIVLRASSPRTSLVGKLIAYSKHTISAFTGHEHIFEPGKYLIVPLSFNFWYSFRSNILYNLAVHGRKEFYLEQKSLPGFLLADSIIQMSMSRGAKIYLGLEHACIYTLSKGWAGLIVVAENRNESMYFHIELNCENSVNVASSRQKLITQDSVPPLSRQVLIVLTHFDVCRGLTVQHNTKCRLSTDPFLTNWPGLQGKRVKNMPEINKQTEDLHSPRSLFDS